MTSPWIHSFAAIAIVLPAFLVALSVHEFSHALAATLFGDDTPGRMGRLTLNPLAHIDPIGLLCLLLIRIGWARPVIFDHRNFAFPRTQRILTALAGPFSNYIIGLIGLYCLKYVPFGSFAPSVGTSLKQIFEAVTYINIMLGTFNLLPIPPLDGGHVIMTFVEESYPRYARFIYQYSFFILLLIFVIPSTKYYLMYAIKGVAQLIEKLVL